MKLMKSLPYTVEQSTFRFWTGDSGSYWYSSKSQGLWSSNSAYNPGDIVYYGGSYGRKVVYLCKVHAPAGTATTNTSYWTPIGYCYAVYRYYEWWHSSVNYELGDYVFYDGLPSGNGDVRTTVSTRLYKALNSSPAYNHDPTTSNTYWEYLGNIDLQDWDERGDDRISNANEWVSGTSYSSTGPDIVKVTNAAGVTKVFRCISSLTSHITPEDDADHWFNFGVFPSTKIQDNTTNSAAEFTVDDAYYIITTSADDYVDTLSFFGLSNVSEITIKAYNSSATLVYSHTHDLLEYSGSDWYDYFFPDYRYKNQLVVDLGVTLKGMTISIQMVPVSGEIASCAHIVTGKMVELGNTLYSPTVSIDDYSAKATNSFGETYLNQRAYAKKISADLYLDSDEFDRVTRQLAIVRSTPAVWDFNNDTTDYSELVVFGYYKDFSMQLQNVNKVNCNLEIEGLI